MKGANARGALAPLMFMANGRAVIAVINHEGKILVGKKRRDINHLFAGIWHIPGETVEAGESDEEALIRGMMEETGLKIKVGKLIGSHFTLTKKDAFWYECFAETGRARAGSDLEEVEWITKEEVLEKCAERVHTLWSDEIKKYFQSKKETLSL